MTSTPAGLWRHADFLKLWAGQAVSQVGSQITMLALPLLAVLGLGATPAQMGILVATETAPFLLAGLLAGVWVDRRRRRPILIAADLGRAALLLLVPLLAWSGRLRMEHLYVVGFLVGLLTVFFEVASQAYLPSLVARDRLVEANGKLQTTRSAAQIAGPGLAGVLVQLWTAPAALVIDAGTFLVSTLGLWRIRAAEPEPEPAPAESSLWQEAREGLRVVADSPLLRAFAGKAATNNLGFQIVMTVFVLYGTRSLGLNAAQIGLVFAAGSVGNLLGAVLAERTAARIGPGPAIIGGSALAALGLVLLPLAQGPTALVVPLLALGLFVDGLGTVVADVHMLSTQQAITPDRLQGRVNATTRFLTWGILPAGGLLGGGLGGTIGLRPTLAVGAGIYLLSMAWLLRAPLWRLRQAPEPLADMIAPPLAPEAS
jgi:MFS family permease